MTSCIGRDIFSKCLGFQINSAYLIPIYITFGAIAYFFVRGLLTPVFTAMFGVKDILFIATIVVLVWVLTILGIKIFDIFKNPVNAAIAGAVLVVIAAIIYAFGGENKGKKKKR